jgi:hypothetical protein
VPVGKISWATSGVPHVVAAAREHLAAEIVRQQNDSGLPWFVVEALRQAGFEFKPGDLQIDLGAFHPNAHNVSTFEVAVYLSSKNGEPHDSREDVLIWLASGIVGWLLWARSAPELQDIFAVAQVETLDVDLRYDGRMAGITVDVGTRRVLNAWGGLDHLKGRLIM